MTKIAVTGAHGRLGSELVKQGAIPIISDITQIETLSDEIQRINPDVVINCAAKSQVQWCEDHNKEALLVNYHGAVNVRKSFGKWMIQIGTDWIFDGTSGPYSESAKPCPLNSYGWSKWGAEIMLEAYAEWPSTIVRVTQLYDAVSDNFATQVIKNLCKGELFLAIPQEGNPTYIPHLCTALQDLVTRKLDYIRTINIAGTTRCSRLQFALKVAQTKTSDPQFLNLVRPGNPPDLYEKTKYPPKAGFDLSLAKKMLIPLHSLDEGLEEFSHAA